MHPYQFEAFSTPCELHIDAPSSSAANAVAKAVFENAKRLESLYSFFRNDSEIYKLNERTENHHLLSDELAGLIRLAIFYAEVTQRAFDIATAGTLKNLSNLPSYHEYSRQKELLIPFASSEHILLEGNRLSFANEHTKIDLGGLVKEYAVDQSMFILQSLGITSALVNFGGDIAAIGKCQEFSWKIGIEDPTNFEQNLMEVELNDVSLCTSGHSKRYATIESEKISHIVSFSDFSKRYSQVSIIAPTTVDAGVWSTALLINSSLEIPEHIKVVSTYF
ncbi:FAD:protein FMN transferase [Sulfuricurvum sp.]|uniref:FAD:protein FMN transferase n=1 Tax=Sulfuricurvum sp. TaxID=2025608 RepID=UPI00260053E0|nr:FAD:protein FMN transferase [Sulfuricurvum sp.]